MAVGGGSCLVCSPTAPQSGAASPRVPEVCAALSPELCSLIEYSTNHVNAILIGSSLQLLFPLNKSSQTHPETRHGWAGSGAGAQQQQPSAQGRGEGAWKDLRGNRVSGHSRSQFTACSNGLDMKDFKGLV